MDAVMQRFRFHGRGGQGVVTAAELLATAAFHEGFYAQAFPMFGSERTGAPVEAYCRLDTSAIRTHDPVSAPDVLVIQDPTLLHHVAVFEGVRDGAVVLLNTARTPEALGLDELAERFWMVAVPASDIARTHLGRPLAAAPLIAAVAAVTGTISRASVERALRDRFHGADAANNIAAARATPSLERAPC